MGLLAYAYEDVHMKQLSTSIHKNADNTTISTLNKIYNIWGHTVYFLSSFGLKWKTGNPMYHNITECHVL